MRTCTMCAICSVTVYAYYILVWKNSMGVTSIKGSPDHQMTRAHVDSKPELQITVMSYLSYKSQS
jgi:hypothetical protein